MSTLINLERQRAVWQKGGIHKYSQSVTFDMSDTYVGMIILRFLSLQASYDIFELWRHKP